MRTALLRHGPDRRSARYHAARISARAALRSRFGRRLHVDGLDEVPTDGNVLVVANHLSALDPLLVGAYFPHTLFAMAKQDLFAGPLASWFLRGCNVFPVDRASADRRALQTATEVLASGGRLMLFLEGTRPQTPGMLRAKPGAGFLLRRSGASVLPIAIWGTERALATGSRLPRRTEIHVRAGRLTQLDGNDHGGDGRNQGLADRAAALIAALLPPEYRGVYAAIPRSSARAPVPV